ncbi:MAG: hypothetical protein QOG37_1007 [Mycobacterium sp.]|nr:hypothetical protein [Mycobacterium sp.]
MPAGSGVPWLPAGGGVTAVVVGAALPWSQMSLNPVTATALTMVQHI